MRMLRRPEVERLTGLSRSTLYAMIAQNTFPKPTKIGARAVAWREETILSWLESREEVTSETQTV